jgi:DNA excision repair protein ERCC-4
MPRTRRTKPAAEPPAFPCAVVVDTREQHPYTFARIPADAYQGEGLLSIRTEVRTLKSGDYSLAGYEHRVAVERKSKADLFGTVGQGRERFERELARLNGMQFAAVVVEAEWSDIRHNPPPHTQVTPKTIFRSVIAWEQRFLRVHWHFEECRESAEAATFRVLERFWKERMEEARVGKVERAVRTLLPAEGDEGEASEEQQGDQP